MNFVVGMGLGRVVSGSWLFGVDSIVPWRPTFSWDCPVNCLFISLLMRNPPINLSVSPSLSSSYGSGSEYIFFSDFRCAGDEDSLVECFDEDEDVHNDEFCSHSSDVGLTCGTFKPLVMCVCGRYIKPVISKNCNHT